MNDGLYFQSMCLIFTTIAFLLFFLGLCIGVSVASTITTFQSMPSPLGKFFGKSNKFDLIRQSSTWQTILEAVGSDTTYLLQHGTRFGIHANNLNIGEFGPLCSIWLVYL